MKNRSLWLRGLSVVCAVGLLASLAVFSTGCAANCSGARCTKVARGCKGKCAGNCKTPCKNADGTAKCGKDCAKPCCAKKSAKCGKDCKKPCCAKKDKTVSGAAAPCHGSKATVATAATKKGGCSKGCGSKKGGCGSKKTKLAKCGPDCTKPCCAKKTGTAKSAAGR